MQVELQRVEETKVSVHLQGVSRHLPLDQERIRHGLQVEQFHRCLQIIRQYYCPLEQIKY